MLEVGAWKHPQFAGEYVPELREVVEELGDKQEIFIEVKSRGYKGVLSELDKVLAPPARGGFPAKRAVVMSFNSALVRRIKKVRPTWRVLLLLHGEPSRRAIRRICLLYTSGHRALNLEGDIFLEGRHGRLGTARTRTRLRTRLAGGQEKQQEHAEK